MKNISLEPRKTTITREDIPKFSYLVTILWALYVAWCAVWCVYNFTVGSWGYVIFYVVLTVLGVLLAFASWNGTRWRAWSSKSTENIYEDIADANYFTGRGEYGNALAVLKRTQDRPNPGVWEYLIRFDKSLYVK